MRSDVREGRHGRRPARSRAYDCKRSRDDPTSDPSASPWFCRGHRSPARPTSWRRQLLGARDRPLRHLWPRRHAVRPEPGVGASAGLVARGAARRGRCSRSCIPTMPRPRARCSTARTSPAASSTSSSTAGVAATAATARSPGAARRMATCGAWWAATSPGTPKSARCCVRLSASSSSPTGSGISTPTSSPPTSSPRCSSATSRSPRSASTGSSPASRPRIATPSSRVSRRCAPAP